MGLFLSSSCFWFVASSLFGAGKLFFIPSPAIGVVAWIGEWVAIPPTQCELCDTDGERATQLQHAVHDMHGDGDLGGATLVVSNAQSITDYSLVPPDGGLNAAALVVARHLLPADPALLGNTLEMAVTLCGFGFSRFARHRRGARRHHNHGVGITVSDRAIDAVLVVGAVTGERDQGPFHLVQQRAGLGGVVDVVRRQCRGDDLPSVGIHADMKFPPGATGLGAVLLSQPFACTAQLQSGAIDQQVHWLRLSPAAGAQSRYVQRLRSPAESGVVGNCQGESEEPDDRTDQPFRLAQGEPKHGSQRQRRQDRQRRIASLSASRRPGCGFPTVNCRVTEPNRQARALSETRVIRRPVGHLALLLRNVVTTRGIGFERHRETRIRTGACLLSQPNSPHQPLIHATTPDVFDLEGGEETFHRRVVEASGTRQGRSGCRTCKADRHGAPAAPLGRARLSGFPGVAGWTCRSVWDCINHAVAVIYILSMENISSMIKVSAAEFQRNIGKYQDAALTQPVVVARNGRERTVMISVEEYHRLKRRDRRVMGLGDFTDEDIAALEETRAPEASKAFDSELKPS